MSAALRCHKIKGGYVKEGGKRFGPNMPIYDLRIEFQNGVHTALISATHKKLSARAGKQIDGRPIGTK